MGVLTHSESTSTLFHDFLVSLQNLGRWIKLETNPNYKDHALRIVREDKSNPTGRSLKEFKDLYSMIPLGPCGRTASQICILNRTRLESLFILKQ